MSYTVDGNGFFLDHKIFGDLEVQLIKSPRAAQNAEFLPARVIHLPTKKVVWSFKLHQPANFNGLGFLRTVQDEPVIILATKSVLFSVLPIKDLPHMQKLGDEFIGGRNLRELISLKATLAKELDLTPFWTEREKTFQKVAYAAKQQSQAKSATEEEAARLARRQAREMKRAEIMSRPRLYCYTVQNGERRHGFPVTDTEWECLPNHSFCVMVDSFNHETEVAGNPIESFRVKKEGAKVGRDRVESVTLDAASAKQTLPPPKFRTLIIKGTPEEILVVESIDQVHHLYNSGVNSGIFVMCPKPGTDNDERYVVLRLTKTGIETITEMVC